MMYGVKNYKLYFYNKMKTLKILKAKTTSIILSLMIAGAFVLVAAGSTSSDSSSEYSRSSESSEYSSDSTSSTLGGTESSDNLGNFDNGSSVDNVQDEPQMNYAN